jgi:hypothetical protein
LLSERALDPSGTVDGHEFLFARKFSDDDQELVAQIDRLIAQELGARTDR